MVKNKIGIALILLGAVLILGAICIILYNNHIQSQAEKSVENIFPKLVEKINLNIENTPKLMLEENTENTVTEACVFPTENESVMDTVEIEENEYIGLISIPSLSLELPVMADWNKDKLNISPCLYSGSVSNDNMVIMGHNYRRHFASITRLNENDVVRFTDVNGKVTSYRVVATDCLSSVAVEEMTAGEFDLTLFTCNYDGNSRITVRCDKN